MITCGFKGLTQHNSLAHKIQAYHKYCAISGLGHTQKTIFPLIDSFASALWRQGYHYASLSLNVARHISNHILGFGTVDRNTAQPFHKPAHTRLKDSMFGQPAQANIET